MVSRFFLPFTAEGFLWDEGNTRKNLDKHGVRNAEAEEVFFNSPLVVGDDARHSSTELRYYALGQTNAGRLLFVVFTVRENFLRIISLRDMHRKERAIYAQKTPPTF